MEKKPRQTVADNDDIKRIFCYGLVLLDKATGLPINFSPVPEHRLNQNDIQLIYSIYDTNAPRTLWRWQTPTEIAAAIGLATFGNKGLLRASKAMGFVNTGQRKRSSGKNLLLCPPLRWKGVTSHVD